MGVTLRQEDGRDQECLGSQVSGLSEEGGRVHSLCYQLGEGINNALQGLPYLIPTACKYVLIHREEYLHQDQAPEWGTVLGYVGNPV